MGWDQVGFACVFIPGSRLKGELQFGIFSFHVEDRGEEEDRWKFVMPLNISVLDVSDIVFAYDPSAKISHVG